MQAISLRKKVFLCFTLSLLASKAAADVAIARRGKAAAKVVVAGDASETEKQAAGELAFFLHIVTGGDFPIVQEAAGEGGRLLVGEGAVRLADPSFNAGGLGNEEIIVRTAGKDLILAGAKRMVGLVSSGCSRGESRHDFRMANPGRLGRQRGPVALIPNISLSFHCPIEKRRQ